MWEEIEAQLSDLPPGLDPFELTSKLRLRCPAPLARAVAELYTLRARAAGRFEMGYLPYLHAKGLEQASGQLAAESRARRVASLCPDGLVWDATCGLGSDAVACQRAGLEVAASDRDPLTAGHARANLGRHGPARVVIAAAAEARDVVRARNVLLDPDRRPGGERTLDPRRWSPDLDSCLAMARRHSGGSIKLAPAHSPGEAELHAPGLEWEWVSADGELVELRAWTGQLARDGEPGLRSVLLLRRGAPEIEWRALPGRCEPMRSDELESLRVLAEPDPAVLRAGLLESLAAPMGLRPIAPRCAYLGSCEELEPTPKEDRRLRSWRVLGTCSLDRKRVRKLLGEHDVGPLTVKKRGHPDPAEALARRFSGPGARPGLLAVARLERGHVAILLEPRGH